MSWDLDVKKSVSCTSVLQKQFGWWNLDFGGYCYYLVCAAQEKGMYVEMDVSAFQYILNNRDIENIYDIRYWEPYLYAVGQHYVNQTNIAFYSILGEAPPPENISQMNTLVNFYRATTDDLHNVDTNHLIMAGGFNHMEDESAEYPWWHTIYTLPNNNLAGFKTYSAADLKLMPTIAEYAKEIKKPLINEEFGLQQQVGDLTFSGHGQNGINTSRADFYREVYSLGEQNGVSGYIFWNMGCEEKDTGYEVNPVNTPGVWNVVSEYAPASHQAPTTGSAC